jgi:hypothetical protein
LDLNGNAVTAGDWYLNTTSNTTRVYNGSSWTTIASILLNNWTITETAGVLYFATSGVNKMKLDASGNLTVVGNVVAGGTI